MLLVSEIVADDFFCDRVADENMEERLNDGVREEIGVSGNDVEMGVDADAPRDSTLRIDVAVRR